MQIGLAKTESDYNPLELFNWLNLGPWEFLLWGISQSLAIVLLIASPGQYTLESSKYLSAAIHTPIGIHKNYTTG